MTDRYVRIATWPTASEWWDTVQANGQTVFEQTGPELIKTGILDKDGQPIFRQIMPNPIGFKLS